MKDAVAVIVVAKRTCGWCEQEYARFVNYQSGAVLGVATKTGRQPLTDMKW